MTYNIRALQKSPHVLAERKERLQKLEKAIGWGQVVKECYYNSRFHWITDTGIAIVVDEQRQTMITAYAIDEAELKKAFRGKPPVYLQKKVSRNVSNDIVNTKQKRKVKPSFFLEKKFNFF